MLTQSHPASRRSTSPALTVVAALSLLLSPVHDAAPQAAAPQPAAPRSSAWEFRVPGGALVSTGSQRHHVRDAQVTAVQLVRVVRPSLAITSTFAWARSRDLASVDSPKLDVFTSDVGVEARGGTWFGASMPFTPFAGIGGGVRSYNHRKLDVDATHNLAGYAAVGGEAGMGRVALRLEVRDYVTGFRPLAGSGASGLRNDVVVMAALRFKRQPSAN